ncbi:MAG: hypothetical protein IPL32_03065 [Chloracidobacterium sp.]|nr:hypothetical protein [Chloracidobacterium sp.]
MNNKIFIGVFVFLATAVSSFAQSDRVQPKSTPSRVIVTNSLPPAQPIKIFTPAPLPAKTPNVVGQNPPTAASNASNLNYSGLSFSQIKSKIAEAKREMQTRPIATALTDPTSLSSVPSQVRIAFYHWRDKKIDYIVIGKDAFLSKNGSTAAISSNGRQMTTRTIRANGVNTPIAITDETGQAQLPLMIQYPVEREGRFIETAYYMSTHPGLVTPEVVSAGRFYVHNTIEIARDQLRNKGYLIQPKVADIAERLATVEHVDHQRFRTEFHPNVYNDIFTLYALNEGQTYRYSVSSAGAGGMVQMIPPTYRMVRSRFPNAALMPDFVEGMRNHVNATQAMLLYMQMTWNDLIASPTVFNAMQTGIATQEQLMAAGYNSNPAKLPGYINRGGANWTTLIPQETKIYLQIYDSLERHVNMTPRKR